MPDRSHRGPLRATVRETGGVFRAEYLGELNPDRPDERALPDFHIGTTEAEVRTWVEQMAVGMGYSRVIWEAPEVGVIPGGPSGEAR